MQRIEGVKKLQEVSSEISFQLPSSSSKQFKNFFNEFDQNLETLGIRSYGVGITTLEEVFLKIGHGIEDEDKMEKVENTNNALNSTQPQ
jgi:ATP-binding cassette subfamily A (ABC1) protein 3